MLRDLFGNNIIFDRVSFKYLYIGIYGIDLKQENYKFNSDAIKIYPGITSFYSKEWIINNIEVYNPYIIINIKNKFQYTKVIDSKTDLNKKIIVSGLNTSGIKNKIAIQNLDIENAIIEVNNNNKMFIKIKDLYINLNRFHYPLIPEISKYEIRGEVVEGNKKGHFSASGDVDIYNESNNPYNLFKPFIGG